MCKKSGLDRQDMELMTIGMCMDYILEQVNANKLKKTEARQATQSDYDSF